MFGRRLKKMQMNIKDKFKFWFFLGLVFIGISLYMAIVSNFLMAIYYILLGSSTLIIILLYMILNLIITKNS